MIKPEIIFYFASTHWDREWYKTVDEFRFRLVHVMDEVISTLENNSNFEIFTTDGQTCILEDYLVIREENREYIEKLAQDGRLIIGPWYTMPDEYLLSSESLIQNLLKGHRIAESYGAEPLKSGYVCDIFGHIANLPQILRGFGIDNALISRGTNDSEMDCFFEWSAPDGSTVLTYKTPEICGYGSFYFEVLHEVLHEYTPDYTSHLDEITERAIQYVERELTRTELPYVILMDGMDHEGIHSFMPQILERLSAHFGCPVVQQRLDEISKKINGVKGKKTGELNAHGKDNVMHVKMIPHTLSSRYDLKSANDKCQNLLEQYAMPCAAIDEMQGEEYIYKYIEYAYSLLLQNHAHDSICGCSIDAVHSEMMTRFNKTYFTVSEYFFRFLSKEYKRITTSGDNSESVCQVKVFNPMPYEYTGYLELDIDFSPDFDVTELPFVNYEQRNSFLIFDESGEEVKYNLLSAKRGNQVKMFGGNKRTADTHRVALISKLNPMGYTSFTIKPYHKPYRITDRISTAPNACGNDWIYFEVNSNGTVNITDKETNYTYRNLHSFIDCCEMGDGWYHIRPVGDRVYSSLGCKASIEKVFDGFAACKFLVRYELTLPSRKEMGFGFVSRSGDYQPYIIESEFTVSRSSKLITVRTTIDNTVEDHRLQLHLPTYTDSQTYHVNQCNLIVEREVGIDNSHYSWKEADISEYPFENMVFMRNEGCGQRRGLLFLSKGGLHEVSCPGDADSSIDITLLRCFNKTVGTDGEREGQLRGKHVFGYALLPLNMESHCEMVKIKNQYVGGYKEFTVTAACDSDSKEYANHSAFTFSSRDCAYITCMPSKNKGIIIRAANYSGGTSEVCITFTKPVKSACLCDFLENAIEENPIGENQLEYTAVTGGTITIQASPYKMINIHVMF